MWYPKEKKIVVFQPHTFSRTKQLLHEFIHAFKDAQTVYLLDIFASARESFDSTISSDDIVRGIKQNYPNCIVKNLHDLNTLQSFLQNEANAGVVITLGAGDIYKIHDMVR